MTEYCSKMTECYIKMAYSKHKMTEYCGDGELCAAARGIEGLVNTASAHRSTWDESEVRVDARISGARMSAGLVGPVHWLSGLLP
jgi:hypothetical protein